MIIRKSCNNLMVYFMEFSKDKHEKFCNPKKHRKEIKCHKITEDELDFREVLYRELHK